jgi:predicted nucleic acid-binding protein
MIIIDTSVWIEFLKKNEEYFSEVRKLIEDQQVFAHEPIFAELFQGVKNRRENEIIQQYWTFLPKVNVPSCWIKAGIFSAQNQLLSLGVGLIDACILVAAHETQSQIWTLDKKLIRVMPKELIF